MCRRRAVSEGFFDVGRGGSEDFISLRGLISIYVLHAPNGAIGDEALDVDLSLHAGNSSFSK
jgi:hypothetical protein